MIVFENTTNHTYYALKFYLEDLEEIKIKVEHLTIQKT